MSEKLQNLNQVSDLPAILPDQSILIKGAFDDLKTTVDKDLIVLNSQGILDLSKRETVELLSRTVSTLEFFYDPLTAKEFVIQIGKRIEKEEVGIPRQFFDIYKTLIFRAKFLCMDILKEEEILELLQSGIIKYFLLPIEHISITEQLSKNFARFIWPPDTEPFAKELLKALESNEEVIGVRTLNIEQNAEKVVVKPTVANWLKDYLSFQVGLRINTNVPKLGSNTYGRVNYLNKKAGELGLQANQREILAKLFELEDWLRYGWMEEYVNASKESYPPEEIKQAVEEIFANFKDPQVQSNYQTDTTNIQDAEILIPKQPPVIPAPKNQPVQRPMEEVIKNPNSQYPISNDDAGGKGQNSNSKFQIPNEGTATPPPVTVVLKNPGAVVESLAKPVVKPVNIEEVMKKKPMEEAFVAPGLKMWNINPPEMGQRIKNQESRIKEENTTSPQPSPQKERGMAQTVDIDKKLEDLEKRIK